MGMPQGLPNHEGLKSSSLYPIYVLYSLILIFYLKCGGGLSGG